jgi:hypothetical protein
MSNFYHNHYKEELIATAVLMAVVVTGSFVVAYRVMQKPQIPVTDQQVLGTTKEEAELERMLREALATPTPKPASAVTPITSPALTAINPPSLGTPSAANIPTYNNTVIEQPYGNGGEYDNADYRLTIANPRLVVSASRIFKVDVILANKRIQAGLTNRLSATIIKEGAVIAESVPFSLTQSATAFPGEQISFTASMSLIAGTDVARLKYLPLVDSVADTVHDL